MTDHIFTNDTSNETILKVGDGQSLTINPDRITDVGIITISGTLSAPNSFSLIKRTHSVTQTISSYNTAVPVLFDTIVTDTFGSDLTYSAGVFTNASGATMRIRVTYHIKWDSIAAICQSYIIKSVNEYFVPALDIKQPTVLSSVYMNGTGIISLPNGAYFSVAVEITTGPKSISVGYPSMVVIEKIPF